MSDQNQNNQRKPYKIEVEQPFEAIAESKYLTSSDLCRLTSELFKAAFADFEGCIFEATNGGEPTISLIFNHGKYDDDAIVACKQAGEKESGSSILDRSRNIDRLLKEGDRYHLSQDGKDVISPLLTSRMFNNGNPNWKNIVSEWTDSNPINYYQQQSYRPQYTKVSFIDLRNLCRLLYGTKSGEDNVEYGVYIAAALSPNGYQSIGLPANLNYMLNITRASTKEVNKIYEKLGYASMGTQIVR